MISKLLTKFTRGIQTCSGVPCTRRRCICRLASRGTSLPTPGFRIQHKELVEAAESFRTVLASQHIHLLVVYQGCCMTSASAWGDPTGVNCMPRPCICASYEELRRLH